MITEAASTLWPSLWGKSYSSSAGAAISAANGDCGWGYSGNFKDPSGGSCSGTYAYSDTTCDQVRFACGLFRSTRPNRTSPRPPPPPPPLRPSQLPYSHLTPILTHPCPAQFQNKAHIRGIFLPPTPSLSTHQIPTHAAPSHPTPHPQPAHVGLHHCRGNLLGDHFVHRRLVHYCTRSVCSERVVRSLWPTCRLVRSRVRAGARVG